MYKAYVSTLICPKIMAESVVYLLTHVSLEVKF
jgi:hypothetical protein